MDYSTGMDLMQKGIKGFHGKFKKMYGQMALRLDSETYLFTGENKLLAEIKAEDIVECDIRTGYLGAIFRQCPQFNAIIFGCTQDSVEVSNKLDSLPACLDDFAQISGTSAQVIDEASPEKVIRALQNSSICLVKGSGIIAAASNMRKTVAAILIAQKSCEAVLHGKLIGGVKLFPDNIAQGLKHDFEKNYLDTNENNKTGFADYDDKNLELRKCIIEFGKSLVRKDLVYGSWGNISVRLDETRMLITPSSIDYFDIEVGDIVEVDINSLEYGNQRVPSGDVAMHANMYKYLPSCNAIVHTHSDAMSVFAACEAGFAISDPTMKNLIGDIQVLPYGDINSEEYSTRLIDTMRYTHAAVLAHHGALFYGPSIDVAFGIAEAVEMMGRNLLGFDRKEEDYEEK